MRKSIVLLMTLIGVLTVKASSLSYLTFETTEGAKVSVSAESLTITISGNTLTAGSQTFTLTNLSKMYFSASDETTGIETISITTLDNVTGIYDMQGHKVEKENMRKGVYIVKTNEGTHKIVAK